ncbi:Thioredoxin-like protein AAED1, chloroplastic [Apostasia shenzhenica]|uniref:Thioredoxin-like protein AAED1, chloroplastic n=1 Tax=Apostasia shenzhenica TaxID=1088818 RepID=A0A2I0BGL9_9ASPA|nr:Thioredoxin-like protein AAED1, chloroplastic [Apostasia shenzhenica]
MALYIRVTASAGGVQPLRGGRGTSALFRNPNPSPTLLPFRVQNKKINHRSRFLPHIPAVAEPSGNICCTYLVLYDLWSLFTGSSEGITNSLEKVEVYDLEGKVVPVVELWRDRKAVVAFARHFGCVLCRKRADVLASRKDFMDAAGVALVLISPGTVDQAIAFLEQTKFNGEVYADPSHSSFDALNFAYGVSTTFTPKAGLKIMESYLEGYRQDWVLSFKENTRSKGGWQQGGVLVAGPGTNNIYYLHKDKEAGDDPAIEDVLKACCSYSGMDLSLTARIPLRPRCSKGDKRSQENGKNGRGDRLSVDWDKAWSSFRKQGKKSMLSEFKADKYVSRNPQRSEYPMSEELDPIKRTERSNLKLWTSPRFTLVGAIVVVTFLLIYTLLSPIK